MRNRRVPPIDTELSDDDLISQVRAGSREAYHPLYVRHSTAARNMAWSLTRDAAAVDDLVAEAFARVLRALRNGGGPTSAFRSYLLTTLRHLAYEQHHRDRRITLSEDMSHYDGTEIPLDSITGETECELAARAFARLPDRWRAVLWLIQIEQATVGEIATMLNMTPNGVSALAYRARKGLRQAYLSEAKSETEPYQADVA